MRRPDPVSPLIVIEAEAKKKNAVFSGTAFSIRDDGYWITAHHVIDGCGKLLLLVNDRQGVEATVVASHSRADVSLLLTGFGAGALKVSREEPVMGQEGFHFGFPQGRPGNVYSSLIGESTMVTKGTRHGREPVLVWADKARSPFFDGTLGGLSGGPSLNARAQVAGVMVAESARRGRSYSSEPSVVFELLDKEGVIQRDTESKQIAEIRGELSVDRFARAGNQLRKSLSVAKVVCQVGNN